MGPKGPPIYGTPDQPLKRCVCYTGSFKGNSAVLRCVAAFKGMLHWFTGRPYMAEKEKEENTCRTKRVLVVTWWYWVSRRPYWLVHGGTGSVKCLYVVYVVANVQIQLMYTLADHPANVYIS